MIRTLKNKGATLADFRRFLKEELMVQASLVRATRSPPHGQLPQTKEEWLANLRKGARIEMLR
jgi:hypothetical protein